MHLDGNHQPSTKLGKVLNQIDVLFITQVFTLSPFPVVYPFIVPKKIKKSVPHSDNHALNLPPYDEIVDAISDNVVLENTIT